MRELWEVLAARAATLGVGALGVTSVEPLASARSQIDSWVEAGLTANMIFTFGNTARSTSPARLLDGAASVVVALWPYAPPPVASLSAASSGSASPAGASSSSPASLSRMGANTGVVASYVVSGPGRVGGSGPSDVHASGPGVSSVDERLSGRGGRYSTLADSLDDLAALLRAAGYDAVVVMDDNRLVDRAVAHRAGLGWHGRNTMLLNRSLGSFTLIGSVVTTAPFAELGLGASVPVVAEPAGAGPSVGEPAGCGSCRACVDACPTGALGADAQGRATLDARRCLAWLLQDDGVFPRRWRVALGERLYGCDACQTSCPINASANPLVAPGPLADPPATAGRNSSGTVDLVAMLRASDDELMAQFGHWFVPRRRPSFLRRNALVVLANVGDPRDSSVVDAVRRSLRSVSPIVRAHAVWAARRLGLDDALGADVAAGAGCPDDPDGLVQAELEAHVPVRAGSLRTVSVRAALMRQ